MAREMTLIAYDRRESGRSGGRVEVISWDVYARQAEALLDRLSINRAVVLGACMGCSVALALATRSPQRCSRLILHWPVGGWRWRTMGSERFEAHLQLVQNSGLEAVVARVGAGSSFWQDPPAGPWASVIAADAAFKENFARQDPDRYRGIVLASRQALFGTEFPTGAAPFEAIGIKAPTLIIPGNDEVHTRSAAYALAELMPNARLWDAGSDAQTAARTRAELLRFALAEPSAE